MKSIIYIKGSDIYDVRLQKFLKFFVDRKTDLSFWGWSRLKENKTMQGVAEEYLLSGGGYGKKSKLFFYYFLWVLVVFVKCLKTNLKDKVVIAIDFDSALGVYLASKFKKINYVYEVYDDFALRYKFPAFVKKTVHKIDTKIMNKSKCVIHVDENRVLYKDCKWIVIENTPSDIFCGEQRKYEEIEEYFAVIGHMSKERGLLPILDFIKNNPHIRFLVVGRFLDESILEEYNKQPNVEYYNYMPQSELFKKMGHCCAIFSLYDPSIEINRLAASNKVYDAMMFGIPVITNKEVVNSDFIMQNNLGFVIDYNYNDSWSCLTSGSFMDKVKEMGTNGRIMYLNRYQFSELVKQRLIPVIETI